MHQHLNNRVVYVGFADGIGYEIARFLEVRRYLATFMVIEWKVFEHFQSRPRNVGVVALCTGHHCLYVMLFINNAVLARV